MHDSAHRLPPAPTNPGPSSTREHRQLHRARRGDDSAFAGLVEHHDEILRSMAARLVGVEDMDQVLITAYVKAYRALPRLGDGASVHAWLYRITYMACLDVLRREWRRTNRRPRRPRREFPTAPSSRVSSAHPSVAPSRDALVALDDLPADQRAVLLLVDRHHVSLTDVGAMLDVHPRQIAGVLTRARAAFEPGNGPGDAGEPDWDPTTDQLPPATDWPGPTTDQLPPATDWPGPTTDRPDTATDSEATGPAPASPDPAPDPTPGPATNQDNRPDSTTDQTDPTANRTDLATDPTTSRDTRPDPATNRPDLTHPARISPDPMAGPAPASPDRTPGATTSPTTNRNNPPDSTTDQTDPTANSTDLTTDPTTNRNTRPDPATNRPDQPDPTTNRLDPTTDLATDPTTDLATDRNARPDPTTDPTDLPDPATDVTTNRTDQSHAPTGPTTGQPHTSTGPTTGQPHTSTGPTTDLVHDLAANRSEPAPEVEMDLRDRVTDPYEHAAPPAEGAGTQDGGGAMRVLDGMTVPEHGPRFWHNLGTRLLAERAAPAMPPPSLRAPTITANPIPTALVDGPPFDLEQLVRRADRTRHRRRRPSVSRRQGIIAVTTVAAVAFAAAALQLGGNAQPPLERQGPIAQEIAARVSDRLTGLVGFRATIDLLQRTDGRTERSAYEAVLAPDGSYRITNGDTERSVAYDATSDVRRERQVTVGPTGPLIVARETTGFGGGTPDTAPDDIDLVTADVRTALRAVRGEERRLAESSSVHGRRVWALSAELPADRPDGADAVRLSVDQDELLPIEVAVSAEGVPIRLTSFRDVVPNEAAPREMFTLEFTSDDPLERIDHGFSPLLLADVAGTVGFQPLQPTYLPIGFTLDTARARLADNVVSLRYRRGIEQVVVSTRPSPVTVGQPWPDPFPRPDGPARSTPVNLTGGAIRGNRADLVAGTTGGPQLWGSNGMLAVTVAGDVTPDELTLIGESLR